MFLDLHFHQSPTGARLAYHRQPAKADPRGIVLICHGLAEHSRRYEGFAEALAASGYHVYAHDHRGHGETERTRRPNRLVRAPRRRRKGHRRCHGDARSCHRAPRRPPGRVVRPLHGRPDRAECRDRTSDQAFAALSIWNSNFNPGFAGRFAQGVLASNRC
jgi:pimeloyl-ACP methyl ester carboxylesterase